MSMAAPLATHLGTPTPLDRLGGGRWWKAARHLLDGASPLAALSPASGRSMLDGRAVRDDALIARQGGVKYVVGADGALTAVPADTLAYDWSSGARELLLEGQATNYIQNSALAGAALGVLGSGGSLPTGMTMSVAVGGDLVAAVTWIGSDEGVPAFDLRLYGQNTTTRFLNLSSDTQVSAVAGDTRTSSLKIAVVSGSTDGFPDLQLVLSERKSGGTNATGAPGTAVDIKPSASSKARRSLTRTCTATDCASVLTYLRLPAPTGPVDMTLRISMPQCEAGSAATSHIPTSGAAVTRPADVAPLWSGAGAATAWAWRGDVPATFSGQLLLGATGGSYMESGGADPTLLRLSGSLSAPMSGDVGVLPGMIGLCAGFGASGRTLCNAGKTPQQDGIVADRSRAKMHVGRGSGLAAGQVLRLRELVAWRLPDRPSAAGCQSQARPWSA